MAIFGYVRVSTVTQAREGESLEAQRRQVTSYAASKGLELPPENVFIEAGVSGSIEFQDRPEGAKLFSQMVSGDMVIFPKLDRAFVSVPGTRLELKHRNRAWSFSFQ